ncbi:MULTISPECIES: glycosyltransferase family 4 protein [Pseudomonas aeruginosa group]|uniref:Similar to Glycosyl transferases group 1 n=2 Tax=Pseudomonas aeruginosa TaxID=287 RepID=Q8KIU0_PSEAI|nr:MULTISPECIES: glycosyltransferase family 4 protein [Pseudomonas aeruginosa group]WKW47800.1 glycosyl transferase [Cloning vector pMA11O12]AAM27604.1 ORF_23; similar to Glycosyl transferases group 1 [Pseudomonas aeruginosa]AVR67152.1 glycosyltransferase WbuB [Pseudomonas paraeruginosa]KAB0748613.1 glycosyltransferase family 4 protein [Pseudomonas aeruginosa]KRU96503.1 glycosyl transferase [Pseudomonas aeruginosa]
MDKTKLKVLVVTQYFWPENMRINDLVADFVGRGHEVTVLTGCPNYPEGRVFSDFKENPASYSCYLGASVIRVPMLPRGLHSIQLALNYLSFFMSASFFGAFRLRRKKFDVVFVYAVSPIMAVIPAIVIGRLKRAPVFVWVLDLWPETLRAVGVLKSDRALSIVGRVVSWIYNRTDYILVQSKAFMDNVAKYCTKTIPEDRVIYFPSWAEDDFSNNESASSTLLERDDSVFTLLFAGNVGEAQDFPSILDAAERLRQDVPMRWVIVGDGRASAWLKAEVAARGLDNVLLLGRHPLEEMPPLFALADALFVSLKTNEVFEKTIPGKVQAYLASGKPVIAMIDGEASRVISEAGAGYACASGDVEALVDIIRRAAALTGEQREGLGRAGREYYECNFSKRTLLSRLEGLFIDARLRRDEK